MDGPESIHRSSVMWPAVWISVVLAMGACAIVPWAGMAFQAQDIEALESPLLLAVAHQIESGPRGLYGPYNGQYPLVLIHAPLYYRLAALVGWAIKRAGTDPLAAALVAGRLISALGFLATLASTYGLARLGGMSVRAGGWAVLLVAATPIYGGIPFEVRPDMLGIAFQTTGILLVLTALATTPIREAKLNAAQRASRWRSASSSNMSSLRSSAWYSWRVPERTGGWTPHRYCAPSRSDWCSRSCTTAQRNGTRTDGCRSRCSSPPGM